MIKKENNKFFVETKLNDSKTKQILRKLKEKYRKNK